jgi:serine/threonine-protein kinase
MTFTPIDAARWLEEQPITGYALKEIAGAEPHTAVFLADDARRGKTVAVKVIAADLAARPDAATRFFEDIRGVAGLRSPAVARGHDAGRAPEGRFWFARDWLRGESLAARLARRERGRLSERETLALARGVAEALRDLFGHGLAHRRLTPSNVIFVENAAPAPEAPSAPAEGEDELARLLARDSRRPAAGRAKIALTDAGVAVELCFPDAAAALARHAAYAAPEQAAGEINTDIRADLYALGCLWHQALLGAPPFRGTPEEMLRRHREEAPVPAREAEPRISYATSRLIEWLLAKDPEDRPRTPRDFLATLAQHPMLAEGAVEDIPPPGGGR